MTPQPPLGTEVLLADGRQVELLVWRQVRGKRVYLVGLPDNTVASDVPAAAIKTVLSTSGVKRRYLPAEKG